MGMIYAKSRAIIPFSAHYVGLFFFLTHKGVVCGCSYSIPTFLFKVLRYVTSYNFYFTQILAGIGTKNFSFSYNLSDSYIKFIDCYFFDTMNL